MLNKTHGYVIDNRFTYATACFRNSDLEQRPVMPYPCHPIVAPSDKTYRFSAVNPQCRKVENKARTSAGVWHSNLKHLQNADGSNAPESGEVLVLNGNFSCQQQVGDWLALLLLTGGDAYVAGHL